MKGTLLPLHYSYITWRNYKSLQVNVGSHISDIHIRVTSELKLQIINNILKLFELTNNEHNDQLAEQYVRYHKMWHKMYNILCRFNLKASWLTPNRKTVVFNKLRGNCALYFDNQLTKEQEHKFPVHLLLTSTCNFWLTMAASRISTSNALNTEQWSLSSLQILSTNSNMLGVVSQNLLERRLEISKINCLLNKWRETRDCS